MPASGRWTRVDATNRPPCLDADDLCFYLHEYVPHAGYAYSDANQLVINYKIPVAELKRNPARQYYKDEAIDMFADALRHLLGSLTLRRSGRLLTSLGGDVALVPTPPSKAPSDPEYDDRNVRVCQRLVDAYGFTLCRDVEMAGSVTPSHLGGSRAPRVLAARMVRQGTEANAARIVFVLDDLLTVGAHFAAVKSVLVSTGCTARICGLFLARAVYEDGA